MDGSGEVAAGWDLAGYEGKVAGDCASHRAFGQRCEVYADLSRALFAEPACRCAKSRRTRVHGRLGLLMHVVADELTRHVQYTAQYASRHGLQYPSTKVGV